MRRLAALTLLAASACTHLGREQAQEPSPAKEPAPLVVAPVVVPKTVVEEGYMIEYRPQVEGRSLIEVAKPRDTLVEIFDGPKLLVKDTAPTAARVDADSWYRVHVRLPSGLEVDRKIQAVHGVVASLRFTDVLPTGPTVMTGDDFRKFLHALDTQAGDEAKLALLKTAAASNYFTSAMVGEILDHVMHRESKIASIPILKGRILDKQNAWSLYQHFTYREDKARVQELLEQ
jgi:hypothetical protein